MGRNRHLGLLKFVHGADEHVAAEEADRDIDVIDRQCASNGVEPDIGLAFGVVPRHLDFLAGGVGVIDRDLDARLDLRPDIGSDAGDRHERAELYFLRRCCLWQQRDGESEYADKRSAPTSVHRPPHHLRRQVMQGICRAPLVSSDKKAGEDMPLRLFRSAGRRAPTASPIGRFHP
ncbi:MAG TPA: hypothetical protein VHW90_12865 [Stellaceae bacterium]|nr:hypothetical protein [Stellaceae bacterium]